jgi:membrane-associated phospholipid phosphatase
MVDEWRHVMQDDVEPKSKPNYYSPRVLSVILPAVFASVLCALYIVYRTIPGPELIVLCFFIYAAYNKRTRRFVADWAPFVALFLSYEAMNGLVGSLANPSAVHIVEPIAAEMRLFGSIPTLALQQLFRTPFPMLWPSWSPDRLGAFFYSLHFIAPTAFGFVLWKYSNRSFQSYTLALAVGTYGALLTFLFYPTAPPWYGVNATRILFSVDKSLGIPFYRTLVDYIQSDPFAAFPSLHAMYPWVISLYAFKIKKTKALSVLLLPLGVWFSAVYLGEHYVVDIIGGILYGSCAFLLAERLVPYLARLRHK